MDALTLSFNVSISVSLNGTRCQTDAPNLQALLLARGYDLSAACACAVNQVFVPRARWAQTPLHDHDRIDVIAPVTGG